MAEKNNVNQAQDEPKQNNGIIEKNGEKKVSPEIKSSPLKFLIISLESLSGDLAWQLKKEGHEVKCCIKSKNDIDVYDGFIEKVDNWKDWLDWSDVIIFDDVEFGPIAEKLREKGKLVVGGSIYTDRLEMDREFGQMEMKKNGINVLPHYEFSNYDEAINFIKNNPGRYVFKPSGNTPSGGKGLLFLGQEEDGNDILELLTQNKDVWTKKAPIFQLQKHVTGVEVAVGAFFNGQEFIKPININFEHKRLFPGDLGPFTGEMGTLCFWAQNNPIFTATLEKMKQSLAASNYRGYVDLNCIVNNRGIYPLEFTTRFGYPILQIQLEGITTPAGEWLFKMARGDNFELKTKKGFQIGARIMVPTYFAKSEDAPTIKMYRDLPILFKKPNLDGVHIEDVKIVDNIWRIAGESGCLLVITGSGTTVKETRQQVYSRINNIMVQNMFYRVDIGSKWLEDSDKLQTWGYLY